MELYSGDHYEGKTAELPAGFVLHTCACSGDTFGVRGGTGCPNRRMGCGFVAPEAAGAWELDDVMTAAEVCEQYGLGLSTVRLAIRRHTITARKSGDTWLLLRRDAEARWGK